MATKLTENVIKTVKPGIILPMSPMRLKEQDKSPVSTP